MSILDISKALGIGTEAIEAVMNHAHHSPFERHLHPNCPFCNPPEKDHNETVTRIDLGQIEGIQTFQFVVDGEDCIILSINSKNMSVCIPGEVDPHSISNSGNSFFLRKKVGK